MFCLKVDWKKRLYLGLLFFIPMIVISVFFVIGCVKTEYYSGISIFAISWILFLMGSKDIIFFEKDKSRNLAYFGGKKEDKWKMDIVGLVMRLSGLVLISIFGILVLISYLKG